MYYELYVDVLFLVNFMMDYLLLLLVRKMLKCSATHGNVCLGAASGAFLTCLIIVIPVPYAVLKFVLFHTFVNTSMIKAGLKIKDIRNFLKALIMLYAGGFLLGGVMEHLHQYVKIGSMFLVTAIAGYYIVTGIWNFFSCVLRINQYRCKVELYIGEERFCVNGMIDTGNSLRSPVTDEPVSILDRSVAGRCMGKLNMEKIQYIPYHTIGRQEGILPAVQIDKMCVYGDKTQWIEKPLIGISDEEISAEGEYEMILNPNLF